ncbi:MAG: alpha/beta hydrolase [Deltaproteobacteria bacterium]|nr:alpha/beta hydrolase [Deltaproteobacteria bacterium]
MTWEVMVPAHGRPQPGVMNAAQRLAHRVTGTGPDVLFLHGWPLHGATWRAIVPELAPAYTCHVVDLPGTGASAWTPGTPVTLRTHARAVLDLVAELRLDRVAFVGHDSGGAIARLAAAELGARCTGLVLGNTEIPGYWPPMLSLLVRLAKLRATRGVLPALMRSRRLRRSAFGFAGCFDDLSLIEGEFKQLFVDPILADPRGQMALAEHWEWSVFDELEALHRRITAPTTLVWGTGDPWFPLRHARAMVEQLAGGAELVELPGKLFVHEERPREWAAIARRALDAAVRPAARAG